MHSLTYYLTLLVIKLKGVKQAFSKDPIDYQTLRKEDVHQPGAKAFLPKQLHQFKIGDTTTTEIKPPKPLGSLILFCHGGAFVYGPAQHHWEVARKLVDNTSCTLWMVDYPKAPEHDIVTISGNIDSVYAKALETYEADNLILIGDSVGGTLITALTQRLIRQHKALPRLLILISPVMDATMSNPDIASLEGKDPMLDRAGVLSAKKMCAQHHGLDHPGISPIRGSFAGFPCTLLFIAENDISAPDQRLVAQRMTDAQVALKVVHGKGMPHIWPVLPVMQEAKLALRQIVAEITQSTRQRAPSQSNKV